MITVEELTSFSEADLSRIDALMRLLSDSSSCDAQKLSRTLENENSHLFVAREDGLIIGCATLCVMHTPEMRLAGVEAVSVLPECRGRHVGKMLMEAVIDMAGELSPIQIHLTSRPSRVAANALYRSLGFLPKETNCYVMNV